MRTMKGVLLGMVVALLLVWTGIASAQTAKLKIEAMSPRKFEQQKLATNVSSGLPVVPKSSVVYLQAEETDGEAVRKVRRERSRESFPTVEGWRHLCISPRNPLHSSGCEPQFANRTAKHPYHMRSMPYLGSQPS